MKVPFNEITIAEPCTQNWDEMEKAAGFNFCKACSKNVIDFSGYTNAQIIQTLASASSPVCGRLSKTQLNQLNYCLTIVPATNRNWMKYLGVLAIGASIFVQDAKAQSFKKTNEVVKSIDQEVDNKKPIVVTKIYGYVLDVNHKPAEGVRIVLVGTKLFALTDKNGRYEILLGDEFEVKYNELMVDNISFRAALKINFANQKQKDLMLNKAEPMIMGKVLVTSKNK